ncbi:MAG: hypothetical protein PHD76_05270 [Methylacidiphilales bacterium]|nr:hypothetical protein [Candidatus Methylacidiphilales bacterium]
MLRDFSPDVSHASEIPGKVSCSKVWQKPSVWQHPGYKQNRLNGYFVLIFELEPPYFEAVLQ